MYIPLRSQLIKDVPWFFEPCFENLGYLNRDCGFSWDGERHGGPDPYAKISFEDSHLNIQVWSWLPMDLPQLTVTSLRKEHGMLDLTILVPEFPLHSERGDYYVRYKHIHPLNNAERDEVLREFETAASNRIAQFSAFLHEHLERLRKAAK